MCRRPRRTAGPREQTPNFWTTEREGPGEWNGRALEGEGRKCSAFAVGEEGWFGDREGLLAVQGARVWNGLQLRPWMLGLLCLCRWKMESEDDESTTTPAGGAPMLRVVRLLQIFVRDCWVLVQL